MFKDLLEILKQYMVPGSDLYILTTIIAIIFTILPGFFSIKKRGIYLFNKEGKSGKKGRHYEDSITGKFVKEFDETQAFFEITGLKLEKQRREILITFHKEMQLYVRWFVIKSSIEYIKFDGEKFNIELKKKDYYFDLIEKLLLYIHMVIFFMFFFIFFLAIGFSAYRQAIMSLIVSLPFLYGVFMYSSFRIPYLNAKKLKSLIDRKANAD